MAQKKRLAGIEIFRIIAAYGVVAIHGLGGIPLDDAALMLTGSFERFAVPFFLATSFYFSTASLLSNKREAFLSTRLTRILIPFFCWSLIYLALRAVKQLISGDQSFSKLIADPVSLLFGAAGVQLYFLPMLLVGTALLMGLTKYYKGRKLLISIFLFVCSLVLAFLLKSTGNNFLIAESIAFKNLLPQANHNQMAQLVLVCLAWMIQCAPFIFGSFILLNPVVIDSIEACKTSRSATTALILGLTLASLFSLLSSNIAMQLMLPFWAFALGVLISDYIEAGLPILFLGKCTFGIYLIHGLFTDGLVTILSKINPSLVPVKLSLLPLFIFSSLIFLVSALLTYLILMNKKTSRLLLGV